MGQTQVPMHPGIKYPISHKGEPLTLTYIYIGCIGKFRYLGYIRVRGDPLRDIFSWACWALGLAHLSEPSRRVPSSWSNLYGFIMDGMMECFFHLVASEQRSRGNRSTVLHGISLRVVLGLPPNNTNTF